jgi:hypothetical protein
VNGGLRSANPPCGFSASRPSHRYPANPDIVPSMLFSFRKISRLPAFIAAEPQITLA